MKITRKFGARQNMGFANRFKAQVIERRPGPNYGRVISETPFAPNLILENGMNHVAVDAVTNLFLYCAVGSGSTPTEDSSGAITATASGTAVTAGTSIFASGDVGKLLRFATGEKAVISAYTDGTHVTIAEALTVASPTLFTMYRINQTGLASEVHRTNNYLTGSGNCGTALSSNTLTHQRSFDFPVEVSDQSYSEVGFSHSATVAANLNTRGIFAGAPIAVVTGQQLRVIYYFVVTFTPISPRVKDSNTSGWPSLQHPVTVDSTTDAVTLVAHGFPANMTFSLIGTSPPGGLSFGTTYYVVSLAADTFKVSATFGGSAINITSNGTAVILLTNTLGKEQLGTASFSGVTTSGTIDNSNTVTSDPWSSAKDMVLVSDSSALPTFGTTPASFTGVSGSGKVLSQDTYITGSYTTTWRGTYATTEANSSSIRKMFLCSNGGGVTGTAASLIFLFDQPQEKQNLYTLTCVWRFTWDRDFS